MPKKHTLPVIGDLVGRNVMVRWVKDDLPRITTGPLTIHPYDMLTRRISGAVIAGRSIDLKEIDWIIPAAQDDEPVCGHVKPNSAGAVTCSLIEHDLFTPHVAFRHDTTTRWTS